MAITSPLPNASATQRGAVTPGAQTFGGVKKQIDASLIGTPARRLLHPEVNVLDFGADPTGAADSSQAFRDAIASFSASGDWKAGTVLIPPGRYRISSPVRIKKSVWIRGVQPPGYLQTCVILPDVGIVPFVFERYNTPTGTTDGASGDGAMLSNVLIYPQTKATDWASGLTATVGMVRRTGTGVLDDWRRHYVCTQGGLVAASGNGPRSVGDDKVLSYTGLTGGTFTREFQIFGDSSGAFGIMIADDAGQLRLTAVTGTFSNAEGLTEKDPATGFATGVTATSTSGSTAATDDELDGAARWRYIGGSHGVHIRAFAVTIRDVTFINCSGNSIHIVGGDREVPNAGANANNWYLHNVNCYQSDGHGIFVQGADTNDGACDKALIAGCGGATSDHSFSGTGYGICDMSLPGNSYSQIHFEAQGMGPVYARNAGGGSTFVACSLEGNGGGPCVGIGNIFVVGGALAGADWFSGPPSWGPSSATRIGITGATAGFNATVKGFIAQERLNLALHIPLGVQRSVNGNVYVAVQEGITAIGEAPSGTGNGQHDGTVIWDFVHAITGTGLVGLGSIDPNSQYFFYHQAPTEIGTGFASYLAERAGGGASRSAVWQYGVSGSSGSNDGIGLMHALNGTQLLEWPMLVPAGAALLPRVWVNGSRVMFGTDVPDFGSFNPGDRLFYKGAACVAGGAEGKVCVTAGTQGTYAGGRTATADGSAVIVISGATMGTLYDQHHFKVGDWVTVDGSPRHQVIAVSANGLTVTLDGSVTAGGPGLAMAFSPPTFKEFGSIAA